MPINVPVIMRRRYVVSDFIPLDPWTSRVPHRRDTSILYGLPSNLLIVTVLSVGFIVIYFLARIATMIAMMQAVHMLMAHHSR